jgi:MFS family permease
LVGAERYPGSRSDGKCEIRVPDSRFMRPEAIQLLSSTGSFGPVILVPIILADHFESSKGFIGIVVGAFAAASFVSSYASGRAADLYGRRKILLTGLFLSGVVTMMHVFTLMVDSLLLFVSARVLLGLCAGMFPAALLAYAYEMKSKMGKFSSWGAAGWGIGSLCVGLFGTVYEGAFFACAAIIFVSFGIALTLPFPKEKRMYVPLFPVALLKRNAPVFSSMIIRHTGANMIWVTYPLFLMSLGADEALIGLVYAVNAFSQFTIMNFIDRFNPTILVAFGIGASAVTFFLFTLARDFWEVVPMQVILASAWACLYVGSLRYVMDRNEEKATVTGLLSSSISVSGILGPLAGGFAAAALGFRGAMMIASVMSLVALAIFLVELRMSGEIYRLGGVSRSSR